jgi:predicted RNA-binding Zn-ribbon protein involved in translation (DUF1610 family)
MTNIKLCLNCGDKLLELAKKCPTCGKKNLLLIDKNETQKIQQIKNNVPNPKDGIVPNWKTNLEMKSQIWNNDEENKAKKNKAKENKRKKITTRERKKTAKENGVACCPKCGFTSLSGNKQGFGIVKAYLFGLAAGNINSKKVLVTCLNCGHQWNA